MDKRLNITISFNNDEESYNYVKNQPNSSYYIRKLVENDMKNRRNKPIIDEIEINDMLNW